MPRYLLKIAYDGTDFHGWQKQHASLAHASAENDEASEFAAEIPAIPFTAMPSSVLEPATSAEPLRTVQGVVEETLRIVIRQPVILIGASRTDAGVHARGQAAAFTAETSIPLDRMPAAINARLPEDVQIRSVRIVRNDFDPIRDAIRKTYRYRLEHGCRPFVVSQSGETSRGYIPSVFNRRYVTRTAYALDVAAMNEAAQHLVGEHDFMSFTRLNHERETTVRTIFECTVTATHAHRCHIQVTGSGFLYNMVRIIAGTLLEVGRSEIKADDVPGIIAAKDRRAAGPTLGPAGLCLMHVEYPKERLRIEEQHAGESSS
ncbi:MAG TPA: tRNA pseudouridine(38-40) synthase TruA [Phycisphaerales bacterium]|nr:tRNA pseudouridine(38-40) synthase TruA [Phycisphaerales bacterium]